MTGGGGEELPTLSGGEFLLRLVQNPLQTPSSPSPPPPPSEQPYGVSLDPAVAAFGPIIPLPNNGQHYSAPSEASFFHGVPHNNPSWPGQPSPSLLNAASLVQLNKFQEQRAHEQSKLMLGKMPFNAVLHGGASCKPQREVNGLHPRWGLNTPPNSGVRTNDRVYNSPEIRHQRAPPPGFSGLPARPRTGNKGFQHNLFKGPTSSTGLRLNQRSVGETERSRVMELGHQLHHPGLPDGSKLHSVSALEIEESMSNAHAHANGKQDDNKLKKNDRLDGKGQDDEIAEFSQRFGESLVVEDEHDEKSQKKKHRDKDFRSDPRGNHTLSQRMRNMKSYIQCRSDISRFNSRFLEIYESLIPAEEEKVKQKKLLVLLEKLVCKEWPNSRLCLYGSCANSFGVSKSDIDICLDIADQNVDKSEVLLKLADILQSDNLENVQALTRARVPIVKLKDPVTGISCDICINNVSAVVNTKLLRDYAEIDVRLRQLAFIVKHWAKSRAVNETYQGTLSSYAYVLMCIHFLQQRRPAILPCLQEMDATYTVNVDGVKYCYFDKVERLRKFGVQNKESLAQLVWAFFNYWAYCHDYANSVISVRTGSFISKQEKDWTRRIGNERHLICIEDPLETSHDLGRVVDKHSIRVLREEFERAASLLQYDPNPCVELFTPYVPS